MNANRSLTRGLTIKKKFGCSIASMSITQDALLRQMEDARSVSMSWKPFVSICLISFSLESIMTSSKNTSKFH